MAIITNTYTQTFPSLRFIGKRVEGMERYDGSVGNYIKKFRSEGLFDRISKNREVGIPPVRSFGIFCGGTPVGLILLKNGVPCQYYAGLFTAPASIPPKGYEVFDFPACKVGLSRVLGKDWDVCGRIGECGSEILSEGLHCKTFEDNMSWVFEVHPEPNTDEDGNLCIEVGHFIE